MRYEKIIQGRIRCEKASQVVTASFMTFLFMRRRSEKENKRIKKENIFCGEKENGEGEGRYEYLEKYFFCGREEKQKRERRKIFGEGTYFLGGMVVGCTLHNHMHIQPRLYKRSLHGPKNSISPQESKKASDQVSVCSRSHFYFVPQETPPDWLYY